MNSEKTFSRITCKLESLHTNILQTVKNNVQNEGAAHLSEQKQNYQMAGKSKHVMILLV